MQVTFNICAKRPTSLKLVISQSHPIIRKHDSQIENLSQIISINIFNSQHVAISVDIQIQRLGPQTDKTDVSTNIGKSHTFAEKSEILKRYIGG